MIFQYFYAYYRNKLYLKFNLVVEVGVGDSDKVAKLDTRSELWGSENRALIDVSIKRRAVVVFIQDLNLDLYK